MRTKLFSIIAPCTAVWFVVLVVLLLNRGHLRADGHLVWMWTAAAGSFLGCLGMGVYTWQRSAARRGRKSAQQMTLDEI